jgi:hypothetical protein
MIAVQVDFHGCRDFEVFGYGVILTLRSGGTRAARTITQRLACAQTCRPYQFGPELNIRGSGAGSGHCHGSGGWTPPTAKHARPGNAGAGAVVSRLW